jgi:hypothetical protein
LFGELQFDFDENGRDVKERGAGLGAVFKLGSALSYLHRNFSFLFYPTGHPPIFSRWIFDCGPSLWFPSGQGL